MHWDPLIDPIFLFSFISRHVRDTYIYMYLILRACLESVGQTNHMTHTNTWIEGPRLRTSFLFPLLHFLNNNLHSCSVVCELLEATFPCLTIARNEQIYLGCLLALKSWSFLLYSSMPPNMLTYGISNNVHQM